MNSIMKYLTVFTALLVVVAVGVSSYAGPSQFNLPLAWILGPDGVSVDLDNNGIIDNAENAERVGGLTAADILAASGGGSGGLSCVRYGTSLKCCTIESTSPLNITCESVIDGYSAPDIFFEDHLEFRISEPMRGDHLGDIFCESYFENSRMANWNEVRVCMTLGICDPEESYWNQASPSLTSTCGDSPPWSSSSSLATWQWGGWTTTLTSSQTVTCNSLRRLVCIKGGSPSGTSTVISVSNDDCAGVRCHATHDTAKKLCELAGFSYFIDYTVYTTTSTAAHASWNPETNIWDISILRAYRFNTITCI